MALKDKDVNKVMEYQFFGHAAFMIKEQTDRILFDPFFSGNPLVEKIPEDLNPSLIVLTHGHEDHIGDTVSLAKKYNCPVLAVYELANFLELKGVETIGCGLGGRIEHSFGWTKFVPAFHSSSYKGQYMGMPAGVMLSFYGYRWYITGDTCVFGDMQLYSELYRPEWMVLPIGGRFTMDTFEAQKAVELVQPEYVLPCHYNTWPPIEADADAFAKGVAKLSDAEVIILNPGETHEF